ncbi:NAD-dependent epimerase/dehydratase family protein [Candidatus Giovannonibacteria bacterium]|nr:NAD-dependent epimerase/dehydratase family protein [Candidatus Giovannonibacteria bacterium]
MSKAIVTGGAGFIGSHIIRELLERGFKVHIIDNLSTGKRERIDERAVFHNLDIRNLKDIGPLFENTAVVFHTAAFPRVQPSIEDPVTSNDVNVKGTLNVLVAARDNKVGRVIYSASSSAYGDQQFFPLSEKMPAHPLSPYGLQKYIGELYSRLFYEIYKLETVSLRYFNVYGPGASSEGAYALVISRFLEQRRRGEPMTVVPDGSQSRDFTHVSDVVSANMLAMESDKVGKGEVINIGGGEDHSVNEIAELIGGPKVFIEPRIEPRRTLADTALAKELLGWEPKKKFNEGIRELKKIYGL